MVICLITYLTYSYMVSIMEIVHQDLTLSVTLESISTSHISKFEISIRLLLVVHIVAIAMLACSVKQ